jgi:hypothetical protein
MKLNESQRELYAEALLEQAKNLAAAIASKSKYKDPEELEAVTYSAFASALNGYDGPIDTNALWSYCAASIRHALTNHMDKERHHDELRRRQ